MMNTYYIKIVADEHYQRVECGGNTPALLEDAIKAAVKEFYKGEAPCKSFHTTLQLSTAKYLFGDVDGFKDGDNVIITIRKEGQQ